MPDAIYDVAIIGGGPAGSTAATLLARAGRRVIVCEREKFPRFHIGESLLPVSMKTFTRLGVHEKFERAGFLKKYGGEMTSACCDEGVKFYFKDGYRSQTESSYQVPRAEFDKVLLDHAAENGAEVREETAVKRRGVLRRSRGVAGAVKSGRPRKDHGPLCDRRERPAFGPGQSLQTQGNLSPPAEDLDLRPL